MLRLGSLRGRAVSRLTESSDGRGSSLRRTSASGHSRLSSPQIVASEASRSTLLTEPLADSVEDAGAEAEQGQSNALQAALNIVAEVMGAGVLSLPYACARVGWVCGLGSVVVFGLCGGYSGLLVSRTKTELCPHAESFADLAHETVGPCFGRFTQIAVLLNWALLLPYFMIACASAIRCAFPDAPLSFAQLQLVVCALLLPPLQLRTLHQISYASGLSTAAMLIAAALILGSLLLDFLLQPHAPVQHSVWLPEGTSLLDASGALCAIVFAYQGQSVYLEIMREMSEPRRFPLSVCGATGLMTSAYAVTVLLGYGTRGDRVAGFLPDDLTPSPAKTAVGLLLALHTVVCYLVTGQPFHRGMHSMLCASGLDKTGALGTLQWLLITSVTLAASTVLAITVPFFPQVQTLLGALTGAPIVFGWPALFFLRASRLRGVPVGWLDWLVCLVFLCVILPVTCALGTVSASADIFAKLSNSTAGLLP